MNLPSEEYTQAIEQAKANLADAMERGEDALLDWNEIARELFTPEEIAEAEAEAIRMFEQAERREAKKSTRRIA